jgi:hypothetical protein
MTKKEWEEVDLENKIKEAVFNTINHKLLSELIQYELIEDKSNCIEQFEKDREEIIQSIINYAKENNLPAPKERINNIENDQINNIKKRVEIEKYLNNIFIDAEKQGTIKDKIQYLINYKYILWPKSLGYNKEIDPDPIEYETEIQKRIDELKQGAPQTTNELKPENFNISFRLKKVEFVELVKALIKNGNIIGEDKKIFMYLVKAFGLDESYTNDYCKVIGDISERRRKNKADFLVRLVDSFNTHLFDLDEKKKSNA